MRGNVYRSVAILFVSLVGGAVTPVTAQVLTTGPEALPFPVLAGGSFQIDPQKPMADPLFRLSGNELLLRANGPGWVDMEAYCTLPERHWGPVSVINCTLEVSGEPARTGLALAARVPLKSLAMGSTITLRLLMQAPLIVLDLEGNPTAVMDTFVEEYRWTLSDGKHASADSSPQPAASSP